MATYTPNYNIKKPDPEDAYNVQDFNDAMNIVDEQVYGAQVIVGAGAPTTETVGLVGQHYLDATNSLWYYCKSVDAGVYTWKDLTSYKIGDILTTARPSVGANWISANGAEITEDTYPELFALMAPSFTGGGKTWGQTATSGAYGVINGKAYVVSAFNSDYNAYEYNPLWSQVRSASGSGSYSWFYIKELNSLAVGFGKSGTILHNSAFPASLSPPWTSLTIASGGGSVLGGEYFKGYFVFLVAVSGQKYGTSLCYCNTLTGTYTIHTLASGCYSMCHNQDDDLLVLRTRTGFYVISDITQTPVHTVNASIPSSSDADFVYYGGGNYVLTGQSSTSKYYYYGATPSATFIGVNNPLLPQYSTNPMLLRMRFIGTRWHGLHYYQDSSDYVKVRGFTMEALGDAVVPQTSDTSPSYDPSGSTFISNYHTATPIEIPLLGEYMFSYFPSLSSGSYSGYASAISRRPYRTVPTKTDTSLYNFIRAVE